jgi:glycosyltransferase involved in cell wall biosynthesis
MLTLLGHLPGAGWRPVLACPPGDLAVEARRLGVDVSEQRWRALRSVSRQGAGRKRYPAAAVVRALASTVANCVVTVRVVRRARPSVVLCNTTSAHPAAAAARPFFRRPLVLHVRDIVAPGRGRRLLAWCARRSSAVIAISKAVADTVPGADVVVEHNPVEPPPTAVAPRDGVGPVVVGYLGRLDPDKGVDVLLRAVGQEKLSLLAAGEPRYGPTAYGEQLRQLADREAAGLVRWLGEVTEPWSFLAGVDVLAVPSRDEPFGRVAAEAAVAGRPVVASACGGLTEVVEAGRTGLLVPPDDVPALSGALRELADDVELRRRLGDAARASAGRFDPAGHARRVAALLDRVAGTP